MKPVTEYWGLTEYTAAWSRQQSYVQERLLKARPDTLILTEHQPVLTLGRRPEAKMHIVDPGAIPIVESNRGGDVTYHGPGQMVGYAIIDLRAKPDLHAYLRNLESVLIGVAAHFGVLASRRPGKTGIWVEQRKLAAIGIAVKSWVTYHGFALNVAMDLAPYQTIVPCGIPSEEGTVTTLEKELGQAICMDAVCSIIEVEFWKVFGHVEGL